MTTMLRPFLGPFFARAAVLTRTVGPVALVLATSAACTPQAKTPNPREALDRYTTALSEGRLRDAYALLSDEAKKSVSYEAFERMARENPEEIRALVAALERPTSPPYVTARVTTEDGDTLLLIYEDGAWRVDASAVDLYGQATPEQAVGSFVRAYENSRYDILMRFVPKADREGLDEQKLRAAWEGEQKAEMDQLTQVLAAALPTAQIELLGDRATLAYGTSGTVELIREDGAWKIEDFQ